MALFCFENTFAFSKAHLLEYAGRSWGFQQTRFAPYVPKEVCAQRAWHEVGQDGSRKGGFCVQERGQDLRGERLPEPTWAGA